MSTRLLAMILAAVLMLAACGTGDDAGDTTTTTDPTGAATATPEGTTGEDAAAGEVSEAAQPIVQAVDTTVEEGSAAFDATVVVDSAEFSDQLQSSGVVDFEGDRRQLDIGTPAGDIRALITTDGILVSLGEGSGWVRADPRDLQGTPLEAYGLATLPLQDPSVNLNLLRGTTEDVTEVGQEDIDGESTTHYEVVVDVEAAAAQADPAAADAIRSAGGQAGGTLPMQVWIDESSRIRRIEHRTELSETELVQGQAEGAIEVTIDLSDFGTDAPIEEPDESQVVDVDAQTLEQLLQQLTGDSTMTMPGAGGTDADAGATEGATEGAADAGATEGATEGDSGTDG